MKTEILAIGSELVDGQKLDTNSRWLSRKLGELGIAVGFHTTLGDDRADNLAALRIALDRANLVITSGGLGPTQDDLTREVLAEAAGVPLVEDAASLGAIEAFFARRNRAMTERNRLQALFPEGAEPVLNRVGTAPGIWMKVGDAFVACLPGVPYELYRMFDEQVVPRLRREGAVRRVIVHRVVNLFGRGEAEIEKDALDLTARGRVPEVGITASDATISFRVSAAGADEDQALRLIEPTLQTIRERFGDLIVGEGDDDVAEGLAAELFRKGASLATAESCTGGLVASRLTAIPGIGDAYRGGLVTYAESAKTALLGVPESLIAEHGVVSGEVAIAMARGAREALGADLGLGITGLAGPGTDAANNPIGLVFVGLVTDSGHEVRRLELGPEQPRDVIQGRATKHAMNLARLHLMSRK